MALSPAEIQNAYVAFFNRPADVAGLNYWSSYAGSSADLLNTLAASAEYQALYAGLNPTQLVNTVYQNLFGHEPDVAGLSYWVSQLANGALSVGKMADAINKGAQGSDATIISNRVSAATAFTSALDSADKIVAYAAVNSTGLSAVKTWLAGVKADAASLSSATSASSLATLTSTVQSNIGGGAYSLTLGADSLTGSAANDTFLADNTGASKALTAIDRVNGGAGSDILRVLNASGDALESVPLGGLSSVETVWLEGGALTSGNALDMSALAGVSAVTVSAPTAMADGASYTFKTGANQKLTLTKLAGTASGATSTVKLDGGNSVTLNGLGTDLTLDAASASSTLTLAASGAGSTLALANSGGQLATLTLTGDKSLSISMGSVSTLKTVNAAGNSAGVTLDQTADNQLSFVGGAGNDTAKFAAGQFTSQDSVDLGAGTGDKLLLADTSVSAALRTAINAVKGVEVLGFSGAGVSVDVSALTGAGTAGISSFSLEGAGAVAVSGSSSAASYTLARNLNNSGSTFTVANAVGETSTKLTLSGGVKTGVTTLSGISVVNLVSSGSSANLLGKESGASTTTSLVNSDNTKFVITGSQDLELDNLAGSNTGSAIDASAFTGKLTAIGSVKSDVLKGGSGADSLQVGAGAAGAVAGQADTLTGGAGADTFKFAETFNTDKATTFAAILKQSAGSSGIVRITDFVAGTDKLSFSSWNAGSAAQDIGTSITLATAQTLNAAADLGAVYAGVNAIAASTAGGALSGVVLTVSTGAAAGTYLYINNATAGVSASDDMLINLTGLTGTLSAGDFVFA